MKGGVRAVGIAESYSTETSTIAGVVVRADRVFDGAFFRTCTVGGMDATEQIIAGLVSLARDDTEYIFIAGIAPAWFNIIDLQLIHERVGIPVICVSFQESPGLKSAIETEFSGSEQTDRLDRYSRQPGRESIEINEQTLYYQDVGMNGESPDQVLRHFTPVGGRPEPLRVARLVARAADTWRTDSIPEESSY